MDPLLRPGIDPEDWRCKKCNRMVMRYGWAPTSVAGVAGQSRLNLCHPLLNPLDCHMSRSRRALWLRGVAANAARAAAILSGSSARSCSRACRSVYGLGIAQDHSSKDKVGSRTPGCGGRFAAARRVPEVGTMTVEERVADFLVKNTGKAYCDDCLARELGINRRQARNATSELATSGRFHRDSGACSKRPHHRMGKATRAS